MRSLQRLLLVSCLTWLSDLPCPAQSSPARLDQIKRQLVKEPDYQSVPRYALLAFGTKADSLVWLVEDLTVIRPYQLPLAST
jgi:hypothetical protein